MDKIFNSYNGNGDGLIPESYMVSYFNSLVFDPNTRTIWYNGMPYGTSYQGGMYSAVLGDMESLKTNTSYQVAIGQNNSINTSDSMFVIGNGVDNNHRKNIFEIDKSGKIYSTSLTTNTDPYDGTNADGTNDVASAIQILGNSPIIYSNGANSGAVIANTNSSAHHKGTFAFGFANNLDASSYSGILGTSNTIDVDNSYVMMIGTNNDMSSTSDSTFCTLIGENNDITGENPASHVISIGNNISIIENANNVISIGSNLRVDGSNISNAIVAGFNNISDDADTSYTMRLYRYGQFVPTYTVKSWNGGGTIYLLPSDLKRYIYIQNNSDNQNVAVILPSRNSGVEAGTIFTIVIVDNSNYHNTYTVEDQYGEIICTLKSNINDKCRSCEIVALNDSYHVVSL